MNIAVPAFRSVKLTRFLWYCLFVILVCYNFHRYIFKYSNGTFAKDDYQQTPFSWQVGKYVLVAVIFGLIYFRSRFTTRMPLTLLLFYAFIGFVLLINCGSIFFYHEVMTDELEYVVFALILLPLGFVSRNDLQILADEIDPILNASQYVLIVSNWIVIFNFYVFDILPFHGFRGILVRFGGLWDDPNTYAIICVLLAGYALMRKQYIIVALHVTNVLLAFSINGYILLLVLAGYWFLNNSKRSPLYTILFVILIGLLILLVIFNLDYVTQIYEIKKESIDQHSTLHTLSFYLVPLLQPIVFHETWFLSASINYFPFSVLLIVAIAIIFGRFFLFQPHSLQRLTFILFFVTNLFLPFLYMFPINVIALLFLVLYTKCVQF